MIYNAGMLNKRVKIVKPSTDTKGGFSRVKDIPLFTVWASIQPLRGREYYETERVNNTENVKIIIRYRDGVNENCKILYKKHTYKIQSVVNPNMENESLELYCIEELRGEEKITGSSGAWTP